MNFKLSFLGGGNMATSMIAGLVADGFEAKNITVFDRNADKLERLNSNYGVQTTLDINEAVNISEMIVLSVKPQQMTEVASKFSDIVVNDNKYIVTVAAGLSIAFYEKIFSEKTAVARVMPNTPSSVKSGAAGIYFNANVSDLEKEQVEYMMNTMGVSVVVDTESKIDVVAACAGSAPAYFLLFMENMIKEAIEMGLTAEQAKSLVVTTMFGTAKMAQQSDEEISTLRKNVTSKGGTTAEALRVFNESGLEKITAKAMQANVNRSKELSEELNK